MVHHKNVHFSKSDNIYTYDFYDDGVGLQVVFHFEESCKTMWVRWATRVTHRDERI